MSQNGKEELVLEMDNVSLNYASRKTTSLKRAVLSRFRFSRVPKKKSNSNTDRELALSNINLKFYSGDAVGVIGLNGAGKSTLLKIMAGLDDDFIQHGTREEVLHLAGLDSEGIRSSIQRFADLAPSEPPAVQAS